MNLYSKLKIIPRKYKLTDFIRIPFLVAPIHASATFIYNIINSLQTAINLVLTANFVDTSLAIFNGTAQNSDIYLTLGIIILTVVYNYVSSSIMGLNGAAFSMRMVEYYNAAVIEKRASLEYRHIEDNDTWELIRRACGDPAGRMLGGYGNLMSAMDIVIRVVSILGIMLTQVWWAALVIIAVSVPLFFLAYKGGKAQYEANKEAQKHSRRADYLGGVASGRDNVEERTAFGYTENINEKWYEKYEAARKINLKVNLKYFIAMKGASLITVLISIIIVGVLIIPLSHGELSTGMFIALVTATFSLVQMMSWQLSYVINKFAENREYLKDLSRFSELSETDGALDMPCVMTDFILNTIEFHNVSFRYPGTERDILKDLSFTIEAGRHYAFVGINGAGKTTITKLLTGLYSNYEGEILINGKSLREYTQAQLKGMFSTVYQDFAKYYIKVRDNIELGDVNCSDEEKMKKCAADIGLSDALTALENGYDTYLGKIKENGTDISGGQWQRMAIARSLYSQSKLRILDEPTASLDPIAESEVYRLFGEVSLGGTTVFITHRLGAARLADTIIVLDDGHAAEIGSHDTLISLGGIYAEMFNSQRSWYE